MLKVHIHSDCSYFAGCENMLPPLISELSDKSRYQVTFSYRYSPKYVEGLRKKVGKQVPEFPRRYPNFGDASKYPICLPPFVRGFLLRIWILFGVPILIAYETFDLLLLLRKLKPDVLHVNNGGYPAAPSARAAIIAGKLSGVTLKIMVVNNLAQDYRSVYRLMDYPLDRLVSNFADVFVTGSQSAMLRLTEVLKISKNKTLVIPNGVTGPTSSSRLNSSIDLKDDTFAGITFSIVAELVPRKGHIFLFKAIETLRDSKVIGALDFRLLVAGEGPLASELKAHITEKNLDDLVFFRGYIDEIYEFLECTDVVVLPSIAYEDFPYVVLEGMSMGKPIIGSYVAGIPEQIDDEVTGLLVSPKNADELARAIEIMYSRPSTRIRMGISGREKFLSSFSSKVAVNKYIALYATGTGRKTNR